MKIKLVSTLGLILSARVAYAQMPPVGLVPAGNTENMTVIGTSPLAGTGVDRDSVPGEATVLGSADITHTGNADLLGALNDSVPGLNLDSASGNPFQPSLYYHGYQASPLQGAAQGLAVYMNGVRFNQPFGDTVNWDVIPDLAIGKLDIQGGNPVFGLNALGGAMSVQLKNGFTYDGAEADLSGGSFGQMQSELQYGVHGDRVSFYIAASELHQDGWRDGQSSDIQNLYTDLGLRGDDNELHVGLTLANSALNDPGTAPVPLLAADPEGVFTSPNYMGNKYGSLVVSDNYHVSDTVSVQADAYYQYLRQNVINGNAPNDTPCANNALYLCNSLGAYSTTYGGAYMPNFLHGGQYSQLDLQTTNTNSYGTSAQVTDTGSLFGLANHFVAGASFDGADNEFGAISYAGGFTPITRDYVGPGIVIDEPGLNVPVRAMVTDAYAGLFATDTLNLTKALALTFSARFNDAEIDLKGQNGGDLTGQHSYNRLNPGTGVTYKITHFMTLYAGYSEANRTPTPAELSCAGPSDACSLANFFVGDPNLKQVVARTIETGVRGKFRPNDDSKITYDVSFFRSDLDDDIGFVNSVLHNRAYFQNIGMTRRQGVDVNVTATLLDSWSIYAGYEYLDATYQNGYIESAGANPAGNANGTIAILPGDQMCCVPANQAKAGVSDDVTEKWTIGTEAVYEGSQYLMGDEANLTPKLKSYTTVNLFTNYQVTTHVQLFAHVDNLLDARYYTFGTFSPTSSVYLAQAPGATNPRAYSPAAPIGAFGGVKVTF